MVASFFLLLAAGAQFLRAFDVKEFWGLKRKSFSILDPALVSAEVRHRNAAQMGANCGAAKH